MSAAAVVTALVALTVSLSACAQAGHGSGAAPGDVPATGAGTPRGAAGVSESPDTRSPGASPATTSEHEGSGATSPDQWGGSDGLDAAPDVLEIGGATYRRGAAVPWFDATLGYGSLAVTTGPETRGACDESFYRLVLSRSGAGPVTVTSHEYAPNRPSPDRACPAIGLPSAVATASWPPGFADVTTVVDGVTGTTHPVRRLWAPRALPAGFTRDSYGGDWPQVVDPTRPALFGPDISWSGPAGTLTLGEYGEFHYQWPVLDRVTVRGATAEVISGLLEGGDRCLQWDDPVTGHSYLCSAGRHGEAPLSVDTLAKLVDSFNWA